MGTIAARDCLRVLELTEQVLVAGLLSAAQALDLRQQDPDFDQAALTPTLLAMRDSIREQVAKVEEDRPLESDLRHMLALVRGKHWELY